MAELTAHLRTRRQVRQPGGRNRARGIGKGHVVDIVNISQRPAEAEDRAVPGPWEGDLIFSKGLVERSSRFMMMFKPDGTNATKTPPGVPRDMPTGKMNSPTPSDPSYGIDSWTAWVKS